MTGLSRADTKAGQLQRLLLGLLVEHQEAGALPTSARFLFYELEQRGHIPKTYRYADGRKRARQPGQDVSDALTVLRERGYVDWSVIVDETRNVTEWTYAATGLDYLLDRVDEVRIDPWAGEPPALIVTESRSLEGVLRRIAGNYLCPIAPLGGQSSGAVLWKVAKLFTDDNAKRTVIYLGDLDLSGGDIEESARQRLEGHVGHAVTWERLALTDEQVEEHELEPVEKYDHRYKPRRRYLAVETEALSQAFLVTLLRERLDALLPEPLADVQVREQRERESMRNFLATFETDEGESP